MFKKTAAAIICLALMFTAAAHEKNALIFQGADYYIFADTSSSGCMRTADSSQAAKVKASLKGAGGETAVYLGAYTAQDIIKAFGAQVVFSETAAGITNLYCFSKDIRDALYIDGNRVNLHISIGKNKITAGSPIIFSSY